MPAEIPACPWPLVDLLTALGILRRELPATAELDQNVNWLAGRINALKGVPIKDVWAVVDRLGEGRTLDDPASLAEKYVGLDSNLNHIAAPLHELDQDGTTGRLWRTLYWRWPLMRKFYAECFGHATNSAGAGKAQTPGEVATAGAGRLARQQSGIPWQEVAERLNRIRNQGAPWTSYEKLAEQIGCSVATVHKAVDHTPELFAWAKRQAAPRARQGLEGQVIDNAVQVRELKPDDEAAIREFIEQAEAETRAWFQSLPVEEQLQVVNDPDKHQRAFPKV